MRKIRLFTQHQPLTSKQNVILEDKNDINYLKNVMRAKILDKIEVFNGQDGDFLAQILNISKNQISLQILNQIKGQEQNSQLTLAFAPVKNVKNQFLLQKAVELNCDRIIPIVTKHSVVDDINLEKLQIVAKESCEQCESNVIPKIEPIIKLEQLLKQDLSQKILILCDESGKGQKASEILPKVAKNRVENQEIIVFIGPEGGFSEEEFKKFYQLDNLYSISLGSRILRADTALISALTLVNEFVIL